jgi:hypothetical protein
VHLGGDRTRLGASRNILGQPRACQFGNVFANGERIPYFQAAMDEQGDAPRRRLRGDLRLIIAGVEINELFPKLEARFAQE